MNQHIGTLNKIVYGAIVVMMLLLAGPYFFNNETHQEAQELLDYGMRLKRNFQYEAAETRFSAAIELRPRFAEAYGRRCNVRYQLSEFEEGLEDCNRALQLDSSLTWVYGDRCLIYSELGDFEQAEEDCSRAARYEPASSTLHNRLGLLSSAMGDHEASLEHYNSAIEIDDSDGVLYYNRGRAYLQLEDYDAAIEDFEKAAYFSENLYNAHLYLVSLLFEEFRYDEAIEAADNMIVNFPDEAEAYVWRATTYSSMGDYDAAFEDLYFARDLDETYPYIYANLGSIYSYQGDIEASVEAYCKYVLLVGEENARVSATDWIEDNGGCSE